MYKKSVFFPNDAPEFTGNFCFVTSSPGRFALQMHLFEHLVDGDGGLLESYTCDNWMTGFFCLVGSREDAEKYYPAKSMSLHHLRLLYVCGRCRRLL
jgi:hypothetical protein